MDKIITWTTVLAGVIITLWSVLTPNHLFIG